MLKVTDKAALPEKYKNTEYVYVGSYLFIPSIEEGLLLIGLSGEIINLNNSPIDSINDVMLITHKTKITTKDGLEGIDHKLEKDKIYYYLSFKNTYCLFAEHQELLQFISIIMSHKASVLNNIKDK